MITTSLYFVVFGAAIGWRMSDMDGVSFGSFIVPGLTLLSVFMQIDLQRQLRHLLPEVYWHDLRTAVSAHIAASKRSSPMSARRSPSAWCWRS